MLIVQIVVFVIIVVHIHKINRACNDAIISNALVVALFLSLFQLLKKCMFLSGKLLAFKQACKVSTAPCTISNVLVLLLNSRGSLHQLFNGFFNFILNIVIYLGT